MLRYRKKKFEVGNIALPKRKGHDNTGNQGGIREGGTNKLVNKSVL